MFEGSNASGGMVMVSCTKCGTTVIDFPKDAFGWTEDRPNQERHERWHDRVEAVLSRSEYEQEVRDGQL